MNETLLGRLMPMADQQELHTIRLPAPPDQVWAALQAITYRDLPLMRLLMGVRDLPARLGRGGNGLPLDEPRRLLFGDQFAEEGWEVEAFERSAVLDALDLLL